MSENQSRLLPRLLGTGDTLFSLVRIVSLGLIFIAASLLGNQRIMPPQSVFSFIWWGYAIYAIALFMYGLGTNARQLSPWLFIIDQIFIAALAYYSDFNAALLVALMMLPTVWAATSRTPTQSVASGIIAAIVYAGILIAKRMRNGNPIFDDEERLIGIAINSVALVLASWLVSVLSNNRGEVNREHVLAARRDVSLAQHEAEAYRERMRALYEVAYKLSTTMNFQTVLDATVHESVKMIDGHASFVLLPTGEPDELYVAAGDGLDQNDLNQRLQINPTGVVATILASGGSRILTDLRSLPTLNHLASVQAATSICCVPLSAGRRNYGILVVTSTRREPITNDEMGMVAALANYAIIGMLNAQLVAELRDERTKLISKEEEVRQQLARDLHDGPAQSVAAITMNIEFVKRLLERDPARVSQELTKMGDLARRTTYDIRTLLFELRPLTLDSQGLVTTLREYMTRFNDSPTKVILEETIGNLRLDAKREGTVFNIIQEATNNALKHAQAEHIWIRLTRQGDELMATVQDDGKGFDLQAVRANYSKRGSFGLLNIDERARMVGGSAEMTSAIGAGTTVRIIVPLDAGKL